MSCILAAGPDHDHNMCNVIMISTTSEMDLDGLDTSRINFSKEFPKGARESFLKYPNKWYLSTKDGCSCGFRHLLPQCVGELGFGEPTDWMPEEDEDIQATFEAFGIFKLLLGQGAKLDCVDSWEDDREEIALAGDLTVNLAIIPETSFRFFEEYRFELTNANGETASQTFVVTASDNSTGQRETRP